jgi:hypothetical protein
MDTDNGQLLAMALLSCGHHSIEVAFATAFNFIFIICRPLAQK